MIAKFNTGLSINTGSSPRQLMVIGFGKYTGSLNHTVVDPKSSYPNA